MDTSSLHSKFDGTCIVRQFVPKKLTSAAPSTSDARCHGFQILNKELEHKGSQGFLITSYPTAADFMMGYPLVMLQDVFKDQVDLSPYPHVTSYIQRLRELPSTQKVFGKYNSLPSGLHHIKAEPAA